MELGFRAAAKVSGLRAEAREVCTISLENFIGGGKGFGSWPRMYPKSM